MAVTLASFIKFWRERVVALIVHQLTQGVTPHKIALSIGLGFSLGVFPVLGTTTALCAVAAVRLRLNQPVIQLVNWLVYPLQLAWILIFIRIGEWILHAPYMAFSLPELIQKFHDSPVKFLRQFSLVALQGIFAWLFIAPFLTTIIYSVLLPPLKKMAVLKMPLAGSRRIE
jgi:uncharacterized protein (DUF2062 family)